MQVDEAYAPCWSQWVFAQQGDTLIAEKAPEIVLEIMVIRSAYSNNKYEQSHDIVNVSLDLQKLASDYLHLEQTLKRSYAQTISL
ncbi:hypothetical protein HYD91_00900 [Mycoplasmopsis bovis]|nr:hypothetical protein [Mycoplasmopsis bovis]QQH35583.1 hypothetical protein HYD91_00900 [Mycoplasmopsis bovis]